MKIGLYIRGLSEKSGGAKGYIENLYKYVSKQIKKNDELVIIHNKKWFSPTSKNNISFIQLKSKSKIICDFILAPKIINSLNLDVCLFPKNVIPFVINKNIKKILSILDMGYFISRNNPYPFLDRIYMKIMIPISCRLADKIVAISKNTKKELVSFLKIPKEKIKVIYLGVSKNYRTIKNKAVLKKIQKKYCLDRPFIFYSGSISPRKNLKRLILSFEKIKNKFNLDLVITGNKAWNNKEEEQMIKENPRIKVLGCIPQRDLIHLYNLAEVYLYISLYEGFGLPILEAQACGCPVITSNISSMPEVAEKGALLVNPYSVNEIARAMKKVLENKKLRKKLINEGYKNVKRFSWKKCAKETLKICKEVYNGK